MDLTVNEVAERLNVTPLTVRRWLSAGALIATQPEDRAECRISETALATFLDARRRGGVQERPPRTRESHPVD
jgi:excisionase family DNA binding protein